MVSAAGVASYAYDEERMLEGIRLARLEQLEQSGQQGKTLDPPQGLMTDAVLIPALVAGHYGMPVAHIKDGRRSKEVFRARAVCTYLWRLRGCSFLWIGRQFNQHHTSAMNGLERLRMALMIDADLRLLVDDLSRSVTAGVRVDDHWIWEPEEFARSLERDLPLMLNELARALKRGELEGHYLHHAAFGFGEDGAEVGVDLVLRLRVPTHKARPTEGVAARELS